MNADRALERLRADDSPARQQLARLLVDDALATPIRQLVDPAWLASQIAAGLEASTRTDQVRQRLDAALREALERWGDESTRLGERVPSDLLGPVEEALAQPYVPSEALAWRILDQPVFRTVMAEVLESSIKGFRSRVSNVDDKIFGGLGRRAAQRGKGLFGGVAESVVGAVAGEVEHQFDKRLKEFLTGATGEALRVVARHAADPRHAGAYAEVRVGVLRALLDTPVSELVSEVEQAQPMAYVDVLLGALRSAIAEDDFVESTAQRITSLLDEVGDGTFGAWLDEVGLASLWADSTAQLLEGRLAATVQTDAFGEWWSALFAE